MDRRQFIKTSMCIGCSAAALAFCGKKFVDIKRNDDIFTDPKSQKFIYKTKEDLPTYIRLEACSLCQLKCPKCSRVCEKKKFAQNIGYGYLKFKDFKKLVDENDFEYIELSNQGEIFLNPELNDIIKYAYEKGIALTAYNGVNLNTLSDEQAEALVKYQFKELIVSIDGATPETYAIYRRGGDFNKVLKNIKKINYYKQKYNSQYPHLVYKFILFGHNEHETEKAKDLAKSLNMKIIFNINRAPDYSPVKNKTMEEQIITHYYSSEDLCQELFNSPQINWNGDFLGCNMNIFKSLKNRNVFEEGLMKVLNSKEVVLAKRMITDLKMEPFNKTICSECGYYYQKRQNFLNSILS